jgi:hypothetical protein
VRMEGHEGVWEGLWEDQFKSAFALSAFIATFGLEPKECAYVWSSLNDMYLVLGVRNPFLRKHLLYSLNYLKCYELTRVIALKFPNCSETTFDTWNDRMLEALYQCLDEVFLCPYLFLVICYIICMCMLLMKTALRPDTHRRPVFRYECTRRVPRRVSFH